MTEKINKLMSLGTSFLEFVKLKITWIHISYFTSAVLILSAIALFFLDPGHAIQSLKYLFYYIFGVITGCGIVFELERRSKT